MVGHVAHGIPLEMVGTVIEMADVAWNALEHRRERKISAVEEEEAAHLRSENIRLRGLLVENQALLQALSQTPALSDDCPPDLYKRIVAAVDTSSFLTKLESLHQESTGEDQNNVDILVSADHEEPSWWVWVPQDMALDSLEEGSGIDNENYVVITEDNVVDGIAYFIARCIIENPKSKVLKPEDLQRVVKKTLGDIKDRSKLRKLWEAGKIIYTLSMWGITLAGLYRHRAALKFVARGVHASGKLVLKAL